MRKELIEELKAYVPFNEQEKKDRGEMLRLLETEENLFLRDNLICHMTASAWVVNQARDKVLMAYHNLYQSWSWLGGHADGNEDLLSVALREVKEESGVSHVKPVSEKIFSLETIHVEGHEKKKQYIPSHLHLNITYLLEAEETDPLKIKEDENSQVAWFEREEALEKSSEPWMVQRIYRKLNDKLWALETCRHFTDAL